MLEAEPRRRDRRSCSARSGATNGAATVLDDVVVSALGHAAARRPRGAAPAVRRVGRARARRRRHAARARPRDRARRDRARAARGVHATDRSSRAVTVPAVGRRRARRAAASIPTPGSTSSRVDTGRRSATPLDAGRVGRRRRARPARGRAPDRGREPDDARPRARRTRRSGCSSAGRSRRSRPSATGSPTRSSRSRRSTRRCGAAGDEPNPLTAALAKATAGRTARTVAAHCQQVLAGIGFTTDHPFHRYLKRTMVLDGLFGSADEIAVDVGRQLLAARRVPTLIEL